MKLPVIKHLVQFIEDNDPDYIIEAIEVLELDVIGELISNMYGSLEVEKLVRDGMDRKAALNSFMQRVMGSIDKE